MNNMTLGKYLPYNSWMHRIDPRAKILTLLMMLVGVFFNAGFSGYLVLGLLNIILLRLSKIKVSYVLKSIKPMLFMMSFLMILNLFYIRTGEVLFTIFNFPIYTKAITQTAYIIIRLVLIVCMTTLVTATTKPLDLTLGIEHLLSPFKRFGFPAHEVAMIISIALRFIPTLLEETERIMKAQTSRGVDFKEGTFKEKVSAIVSLIVPLFITAFSRAEELSNAMEARCYNPEAKRTRYKVLHWSINDSLLMFMGGITIILLFVMSVIGTW